MSSRFPYDGLAPEQIWLQALSGDEPLDPQGPVKFTLTPQTRIASCGSCFAGRIALELRRYGLPYMVEEPGPAALPRDLAVEYGYFPYSARYGNVYTSLQLSQLLDRAFGDFVPQEAPWRDDAGAFRDPFRPIIQPVGFDSAAELEADRDAHLDAVRSVFREVDVFIVTLGLTDVWCSRSDGAAFPRCPGRGIGSFDDALYEQRNLSVDENVHELTRFIEMLGHVNPQARVLLSVSPVHVAATIDHPHIGRASTYSKANLRAASETIVRRYANVEYLASYEIATLPRRDASAYAADRRHVTDETVRSVMRSFFLNFLNMHVDEMTPADDARDTAALKICDEDDVMRLAATDR